MKDRLTDLGFAAGWRVVRALPQPVATAAFRAGADRSFRKKGPAVRRLEQNLSRVLLGAPVPDELLRAGLRSYARYWMEAFRLPSRTRAQQASGFVLDRGEELAANNKQGIGSIVALPHAGNWDAAGAWVAATGLPITTVAERLKPEALYQRFLAYRQSLGMNIIPTEGSTAPPTDLLVQALGAGHVVPLLADRDLSRRGIEVKFFGGRTRMPAGPALLAVRTGAPLYVAKMWFDPERPHGALVGPLPVPTGGTLTERISALTQTVADEMAKGIAEHPADWHMLQKLWLD
ncbi:phosphatidylinositol mannoside acyltransferase [Hamadaea tsunoensis]|uniref:phosphatidylinositol mannoside acyltransferase n=1 Tax=Hamadaea tsunoensis TaxID=53368 RepID=UPI0003FDC3A8|nr:phosphatidylinositol mannoside acyltransferase [Hamadaea tsunoensis]